MPQPEYLDPDASDQNAPPKLPKLPNDGDPWTTVLVPELEADTVRCNTWKEEVETLLIFAGLFSAVSTAFVIQSYKFLQPHPNDVIIGLLFHITNGLNNTSPFPPSVDPSLILTPFSQSSSSVRINVFWFLSLILSLTTVLIGTIALQWLREHQSYVGYSEKEKVAILHMRLKAIEAWHVPQVFAALPLLLQGALVLFLAGLIDFSLPLGKKLTIPVSLIIGLTLLFLTATTILPTLQGVSFLWRLYPRKWVPTPCPYKSPQSHALRMLVGIILRSTFRISPEYVYGYHHWIWTPLKLLFAPLYPSAYKVWSQHTWLTFDRAWLSLRDACHQGTVDSDPNLYEHRETCDNSFPLLDATQFVVKAARQPPRAKHTESFINALIYCFQELSNSLWAPSASHRDNDRHSNYFEELFYRNSADDCSIAKFLLHGGRYEFSRFADDTDQSGKVFKYVKEQKTQQLFSDDHTLCFIIDNLQNHKHSQVRAEYQFDLWVRIMQSSSRHLEFLTPADSDSPIPRVISSGQIFLYEHYDHFPGKPFQSESLFSMLTIKWNIDRKASSTINVLSTLLKGAASLRRSRDMLINSLLSCRNTTSMFHWLPTNLKVYYSLSQMTQTDIDKLVEIVKFIVNDLNYRWPDTPFSRSQDNSRDLFFYFSAMFIYGLVVYPPHHRTFEFMGRKIGQAVDFKAVLYALYRIWKSVPKNEAIETHLTEDGYFYDLFYDDWWRTLFKYIPKEPVFPEGDLIDSHPGTVPSTSSEVLATTENRTLIIVDSLAIPLAVVEHSPGAQQPHDDDVNIHRTETNQDSQPEYSIYESPSTLGHRADESITHAPSDSLTIRDHPAMVPEGIDILDDLAPSLSRSPSDGRSGPLTPEPAPTTFSQSLLPPDAADPDPANAESQPTIGMTSSEPGRSDDELEPANQSTAAQLPPGACDKRILQAGEPHLSIDIGSPTILEQVPVEMPVSGDEHEQDEARPQTPASNQRLIFGYREKRISRVGGA